ncbi:lytic transglycosylase domain-containing protein [Entomospira entomophila]|uniref:Lytic transglycosylase domain-containing protein n=1 Tax=Entomospira entomophila TaxID=2719988 RepID=A0A968GC18_9SPIO|nr:lytic transglycosylase domain-containing protein [Entomospira entomophilus]NIZ40853.1 lytic transglycosylase domain-containing protein [Entomospira entomophilus]WDI35065.1 lytic transglycosylase domain-containing protein [Entomospira entomophilus]
MKPYKYLLLYLIIISFYNSCSRSQAEEIFTAPRDDKKRAIIIDKFRTNTLLHGKISTKDLQQAGLGSEYYYSYHLEQANQTHIAFTLLLENITEANPWREYNALRAYSLAKEHEDRLKLLAKNLHRNMKQEPQNTTFNYILAEIAYQQNHLLESQQRLRELNTVRIQELGLSDSVERLNVLTNSGLRTPYWQEGLATFLLSWPLPHNFSSLSKDISERFTETEFPISKILPHIQQIMLKHDKTAFHQLMDLLDNDPHLQNFFIDHPYAVRLFIQLAGRTTQRTQAIEHLESLLQLETASSSAARFELLRAIGVLEWNLGRYEKSLASLEQALSLTTNNDDYNDILWYYLFALYRINVNKLITFLENDTTLIRSNAGWYDNLFAPILRDLVATNQFHEILQIYKLIVENQASNQAQAEYAWVLARAIQHAFIPGSRNEMLSYLEKTSVDPFSYASFMASTVLNETPVALLNISNIHTPVIPGHIDSSAILPQDESSLVYRTFAASVATAEIISPDLHALGFLYYHLPQEAITYSKTYKDTLHTDTIRLVARGLYEHKMYLEAIRMLNRARSHLFFQPDQDDLKILYPLAFYEEIQKAAQSIELKPSIYLGLIRTESGFSPDITSRASAVGLAQIMPATASDMAKKLSIPMEDLDLTDVEQNLLISSQYIYWMQGRLDGLYALLAGYNGGPNRVRRWRQEWNFLPDELFIEAIPYNETRNYVKSIVVASAAYEYLYHQETPAFIIGEIFPTLQRTAIYATQH